MAKTKKDEKPASGVNLQEKPGPSNTPAIVPRNKNDGSIGITISADEMEARGDFYPPAENGELISDGYINSLLVTLNIIHGVQWETIQDAVMLCQLEKKPVMAVLIAKGDEPVDEKTEYFEINPHIKDPVTPLGSKGRIDYRAITPFIIVKQDQILAQLRPKKEGKLGKTIRGVELPYKSIRIEGVSGGQNTRTDEKYIYSQINGQFMEVSKVLNVYDSLVVKGPVGYATGHIIFPGDITIEGPVSDGFKIYSGGSVTIKQTFDLTEANIKGDLAVLGGIIGRGRALVKIGGALKTKFIDNCHVACRKSITVDMEILNSSVYTMENLEMGDKGNILGSDIYAIHGVKVGNIGKKSVKHTHIHCGVDFAIQQEMEKNNNQLKLLSIKLTKLREVLGGDTTPQLYPPLSSRGTTEEKKRAKLEELLHKLEGERDKITQRLSDLMTKTNSDEDALVEVSGEIAPGTLIEICQRALFVSEPLRRVRVKMDKIAGKLVSEPL